MRYLVSKWMWDWFYLWWPLLVLIIVAVLVIPALVGCSDSQIGITGPTGPPVQDPGLLDGGPTESEPVFNPGPAFSWDGAMVFSSFALNSRDEQTQRQHLRSARNRGYNTARICVELENWNNNAFSGRGPYLYGAESLRAFEDTLRVLADEGMQVVVMAICSELRSKGSNAKREAWVRAVGKRTAEYDNVIFEAANEADHPRSVFRNDSAHINRLISILRSSSGGALTGSDQNLGAKFENIARYRYDYRWRSDFASFHPWRFPRDPDRGDIRDIVNQNSGFAFLSETTSWTADPSDLAIFGHLVTASKTRIKEYMDNCLAVSGCIWTFHSIEGLYADGPFTWMPQR